MILELKFALGFVAGWIVAFIVREIVGAIADKKERKVKKDATKK